MPVHFLMDFIYYAEILLVFICGALLSMVVIPKISLVSFKKRLFDAVDSRKVHTGLVPRLGGMAFFPCISVAVSLGIVSHNLCLGYNLLDRMQTVRLFILFSLLFLLYLIGMMDDLIGVRCRSKLVIQFFCGILLVSSGLYFDSFYGLFGITEIPRWVGMFFTVFVIVCILNAINFIDGIDGLASGLGGMAFLAFGCMFIGLRGWIYAFLSFAALGVLIPFFYYNVFGKVSRGRKIFMGDTGSLTIGLLLAALAIRLSMSDPVKEEIFPGAIVIVFSFLIVPILDMIQVVIHRLYQGKSPFLPDKKHIHHQFIALGFTQRQTLTCILGIAFIFAFLNVYAIHYISISFLFLLDVWAWMAINICIRRRINNKLKRKK